MNEVANKTGSVQAKAVRSLIDIPLSRDAYDADLEVTDRYQQFSTEMLRLSLASIGVFGFFLTEVVLKNEVMDKYLSAFSDAWWCFTSGILFLAISAGLALTHRFYSSDCIAMQIRYLRAKVARDNSLQNSAHENETDSKHNKMMRNEKSSLRIVLKRCGWILALAALSLGVGIVLVALGFAWTLFRGQ